MALHGELKIMPLSDILQSLRANHQCGTLNLLDGKKEFSLFFENDAITGINPGQPSREYFSPILCYFLEITEEVLDREFKKKLKLSIADRLQKSRIANATRINELHRTYLTESLYNVFMWQSGTFAFEDSTIPGPIFDDDQRNCGLKLEVDMILFESMRRIDEWKLIAKQIPSMDDVFTIDAAGCPPDEQLPDPHKTIFGFCNGENSIKEIAYRSGQDLFTTASILCDALENHVARRITPNDLINLAEKSFSNNKRTEALRYFKRAIELDRGNVEVRHRFADLCVQMGMHHEATNEYKTLAQFAREKKEFDRARLFYRQIIAMNPSEYDFQKRLYEMLRDIKDPDVKSVGLELADTLKRLGLRRDEILILKQIIEDNDHDAFCFERLGDAQQSLSHEKSATENFYTAAELFANQENFQSAIRIYEKILALNPDEVKASKRLDELKSGIYLKKKRRRRRIIVIAQSGILLLAIITYLCYTAVSTVDYLNMRNRNLQYLFDGDFEQLHGAIRSFQNKYPLSLVNIDFKRYCGEIELIGNAPRKITTADTTDVQSSALVNANQPKSHDSSTGNFSCSDSIQSGVINDIITDTTSLQ
ncbi:MAG: DUF4388 domain-containing protein [Chitinispirillaceae bacterium]|nr:DUF4388 domain-containing protein [Chitinispirillaceae bacterium]